MANPSEREVAGAYGALGERGAGTGGRSVPTERVGALVRALGANVRRDERDILRRCEEIADPAGSGTFDLKRVRARGGGGREARRRAGAAGGTGSTGKGTDERATSLRGRTDRGCVDDAAG